MAALSNQIALARSNAPTGRYIKPVVVSVLREKGGRIVPPLDPLALLEGFVRVQKHTDEPVSYDAILREIDRIQKEYPQ